MTDIKVYLLQNNNSKSARGESVYESEEISMKADMSSSVTYQTT